MKPIHYILIIAAGILAWYYYSKNKTKKNTTSKKEDKTSTQEDKSENADVATLTMQEAISIAEKDCEDFQLSQDLGDLPENKWTIGYTDEEGSWHFESISKATFDALVERGYEADYN